MHPILNNSLFLVRERAATFGAFRSLEIYNPQTQQKMMVCREEKPGLFTRILRLTGYRRFTPFNLVVASSANGDQVLRVKRHLAVFSPRLEVLDEHDKVVGKIKQKPLTLHNKFRVLDAKDNPQFSLKGKWTSWGFRFVRGDMEIARVSQRWTLTGKNPFDTTDSYLLQIEDQVPQDHNIRLLLLGTVLGIDMVLKV